MDNPIVNNGDPAVDAYARIEQLEAKNAALKAKLEFSVETKRHYLIEITALTAKLGLVGDWLNSTFGDIDDDVVSVPVCLFEARKLRSILTTEPKVIISKVVQYHKNAGSRRIDIRNDRQPHMGLPFARMILIELAKDGVGETKCADCGGTGNHFSDIGEDDLDECKKCEGTGIVLVLEGGE